VCGRRTCRASCGPRGTSCGPRGDAGNNPCSRQGDQVVAPGSTPVSAICWETGMVIGLGGRRPATVPPVSMTSLARTRAATARVYGRRFETSGVARLYALEPDGLPLRARRPDHVRPGWTYTKDHVRNGRRPRARSRPACIVGAAPASRFDQADSGPRGPRSVEACSLRSRAEVSARGPARRRPLHSEPERPRARLLVWLSSSVGSRRHGSVVCGGRRPAGAPGPS
jgi:hypothetical protein